MNCKGCVHYERCKWNADTLRDAGLLVDFTDDDESASERCIFFKNKANFVELLCKVGDTVYYPYEYGGKILEKTIKKIVIEKEYRWLDVGVSFLPFENIGKTVFLTKEEAEQKLKGGADDAK